MHQSIPSIIILLLAIPLAAQDQEVRQRESAAELSDEQAAVIEAMNAYKRAILAGDGEAAVELIDRKTIKYYDELLEKILYADSVTMVSLPIVDQISILLARQTIPLKVLKRMDGSSFFVHSIDAGWTGNGGVRGEIGNIEIFEDWAVGYQMKDGEPTPIGLRFNRENGAWRLDLTSILLYANIILTKYVDAQPLSRRVFLQTTVEQMSGVVSTDTMWHPPVDS